MQPDLLILSVYENSILTMHKSYLFLNDIYPAVVFIYYFSSQNVYPAFIQVHIFVFIVSGIMRHHEAS
jgi:hypothetical protein